MGNVPPAFEYADSYTAWHSERAAYAERARIARAVVSGLVHAAGAVPPSEHRPTRREYEAHRAAVLELALSAYGHRARNPRWEPGSMYLGALRSCGVRWDEVEAVLAEPRDMLCEHCGKADMLVRVRGERLCDACACAEARRLDDEPEREAKDRGGCACRVGGLCRECTEMGG